jgi:hypothetical protein
MNLLIHSLTEFSPLLLKAFEVAEARAIVEVGSESGGFTAQVLDWLAGRKGHLTTIDPMPDDRVRSFATKWPGCHTLLLERTPAALRGLPPADVYLLDGDHNYWTVSEELKEIQQSRTSDSMLVVLHDVGWPSGRRDQYYSPQSLPASAVHPHTHDRGVVLGNPATIDGGFRGAGSFAWALHEGGPRNGVLTAVEDFMAANPGYELIVVPAVFGLGILIPTNHPQHDALHAIFAPYDRNPLLERLENNRLRNYLRVIELQDQIAGRSRL